MSRIDHLIAEYCPKGVPFEDLGNLVHRGTNIKWSDAGDEQYKYIDLTSVDRTTHKINNTESISPEDAPSRAQQVVREGDVLFGTTRPMLKRYCLVPAIFDGQIASTGYCVLRPDTTRLHPNYLFHLLGTAEFYSFVEANERGASYPAIPDNVVKKFRIPVPPLEVQWEIARLLDEFSELEARLEAELESELQARTQQYSHYRESLFAFNDAEVPWATLGEVAINLDSQRKPVTKSARVSGEIPYYGASGIVDYVSEYIFDGDFLLVSEDGANLLARSTPIAFSISGKTWVNNHAHVLRFQTYTERRFAEIYLNSIDLAPYVTGSAQPKLNKANLNTIPVPVPPLAEQERVVSILNKFDSQVTDLRANLSAELAARRQQYEHYRDRLVTLQEIEA